MTTTAVARIVMGVSGCGKSTVGEALAQKLHCAFFDADNFHPPQNKSKMAAGIALTDADRAPWLSTLNQQLALELAAQRSCVLACSALKQRYREVLRDGIAVQFIYLSGSFDEIANRLAQRQHEYMPPALLKSQFEALELPLVAENVLVVPIAWSLPRQIEFICKNLTYNIKNMS